MVRFPCKVAECLTKLPENVLLEHFRFLYSFIAFLVSISMVVSRLNQLIGQGRSGLALITREIQYFRFLGALTNLNCFWQPAVQLLVYSDFHNKKR